MAGVAEGGGWEGQEDDVAHAAAMEGAVAGAVGGWGGGGVGGG